jgi:thiol-disulfide isomerase/thioredoxin
MRDRRLAGLVLGAILLSLFVGPLVSAVAGMSGYFACQVIRYFEPCPDVEERGARVEPDRVAREPAWLTERRRVLDPQTPPVESIWAEPGRASDGGASVYVPPGPVREFLDAPTAERARAYLAWNQQRLDAIARATEVMKAVAVSQPQRSATSPGSSPGPATCVAPAESGPLRDPRFPEPGLRTTVPASADGRLVGRGLAVVYAFASWCPYSARQTPIIAAWARSRPDLPVVGLLLDSPPGAERQLDALPFPVRAGNSALRDQLGVRGYPTILFLRDGVPIEAISGVTPTTRLEAMARGLGA